MSARGSACLLKLLPQTAFNADCLQDIELSMVDSDYMRKSVKHYFQVKDVAAVAPEHSNGSDADNPLKIEVRDSITDSLTCLYIARSSIHAHYCHGGINMNINVNCSSVVANEILGSRATQACNSKTRYIRFDNTAD